MVVGRGDVCGVVAGVSVGVDGDGDEVLLPVAGDEAGDGFRPGVSGVGVGGQDGVPGADVLDGGPAAVCHEDGGAGQEAVTRAVRPFLLGFGEKFFGLNGSEGLGVNEGVGPEGDPVPDGCAVACAGFCLGFGFVLGVG